MKSVKILKSMCLGVEIMEENEYIAHESIRVGIILSAVGGILESHSFLFRDGVFANAQTGNVALLALSILNSNFEASIKYTLPIVAFIAGVVLAELIKKFAPKTKNFNWHLGILIVEMAVLFLVGFIPKDCLNNVVTTSISFVCSLQISGFKRLKGLPYSTAMCTGDLRSASANMTNAVINKDKQAAFIGMRYVVIILAFFTGVLAGGIITDLIGKHTLWTCSLLLALACVFMIIKSSQKAK